LAAICEEGMGERRTVSFTVVSCLERYEIDLRLRSSWPAERCGLGTIIGMGGKGVSDVEEEEEGRDGEVATHRCPILELGSSKEPEEPVEAERKRDQNKK